MEILKKIINIIYSKELTNKNKDICNCKRHHNDYCEDIMSLFKLTKNNMIGDLEKAKKTYQNLLKVDSNSLNISDENLKQIMKDLSRTYPNVEYFKNNEGQNKMLNVLKAFSVYYKEICYVQGMNFIVGFFLYHSEEYLTFWLFTSLIEEYDLRQVYLTGLPGLESHANTLENLMKENYKNLYLCLHKKGVEIHIIIVEWVFSLFSSVIPIQLQMQFYFGFFADGWKFFYKMCISVLKILEIEKNQDIEADEIYLKLKFGKHEDNYEKIQYKLWKNIIDNAFLLESNS